MHHKIKNIIFGITAFMLLLFVSIFIDNMKSQDALRLDINYLEAENKRLKAERDAVYEELENKDKDKLKLFEDLVISVIEVESGGNPNAENEGCNGLMQIKGGSFNPNENVEAGSKILATLIAKSVNEADAEATAEDILHRSLTAYNRGWAGANRYKAATGTFTSGYSNKILNRLWNKK